MRWSGVVTLRAIAAVALTGACSESPSDIESPDLNTDDELVAHTPHSAASSAVLASLPAYTQLDAASVQDSRGSMRLAADAGGEIPRHPDSFIQSVAVFGYAWADLDAGKALVTVIHPVIGRDSKQNPDGWHTHPVQLTGGTTGSGGTSDFCIVTISRSQAGIAIRADQLQTNISLHWAGLEADALDVAASFIVQLDTGCTATGLGVHLLDTADL